MTKPSKPIQHIALLRLSALGDVALVVPLVWALQQQYPQAEITWVTSAMGAALLEGLDGVRFIVVPKPKSFKQWWRARQLLRGESFDVLLVLQASLSAHLLCPLIRSPRKIGFDAIRGREGHGFVVNERIDYVEEHFVDAYFRFGAQLGVAPVTNIAWNLPVAAADYAWAQQQLQGHSRWLAVNVMASKEERCWLVDRYVEVIDRVMQSGIGVVLTGGDGDKERALNQAVIQRCRLSPLDLVGNTAFKQLLAVLATVDGLLAPDTGPVHLARAVNTPVIGLYAVATPRLTGPYRAQAYCIDRYPEALETLLPNKKGVTFHTRVHDKRAMALIAVDDVMQSLRQLFKEIE